MAGQPAERGLDLAQLIVAHSLRIGLGADGRLPTERQLAEDLGVTRSSIRYALGILEAQGQVSREVGRGTYLRSPPVQPGRDSRTGRSRGPRRRTRAPPSRRPT